MTTLPIFDVVIPVVANISLAIFLIVHWRRRRRPRLEFVKQTVTAKSRKLTARWTVEYQSDDLP